MLIQYHHISGITSIDLKGYTIILAVSLAFYNRNSVNTHYLRHFILLLNLLLHPTVIQKESIFNFSTPG